jgi:hypothetical protein
MIDRCNTMLAGTRRCAGRNRRSGGQKELLMRDAEITKLLAHRNCSTSLASRGRVPEDHEMTRRIRAVTNGGSIKRSLSVFDGRRVDRLSDHWASRRVERVPIPSDEVFGTPDGKAFGGLVRSAADTARSIAGRRHGGLRFFRPLSGRAGFRQAKKHQKNG